MERDFTATRPNELWLTDITEHRTAEGKRYLCAIKDVYSNRIVGYSIDHRMKASLAVASLRNAISLRRPTGTMVVHSDRGSQFQSKAYVRTLKHNGLIGSMGRVGACGDNAAVDVRSSPSSRRTSSIDSGGRPGRSSAWPREPVSLCTVKAVASYVDS